MHAGYIVIVTIVFWFLLFAILAIQDYKKYEIDAILAIIWLMLSLILAYLIQNLAPFQTDAIFKNNFILILLSRLISVTLFLLLTLGILKLTYPPEEVLFLPNISRYLGSGDIIIIYGLAIILSFDYFYPLMIFASVIGIIWKLLFKKRRIPFVTMLFGTTTIILILSLLPKY